MTPEQFENDWFGKRVKNLGYYQIPDDVYTVTAALLHYEEDDTTIFAIMSDKWSPHNGRWYTLHLDKDEVQDLKNRFEVLDG